MIKVLVVVVFFLLIQTVRHYFWTHTIHLLWYRNFRLLAFAFAHFWKKCVFSAISGSIPNFIVHKCIAACWCALHWLLVLLVAKIHIHLHQTVCIAAHVNSCLDGLYWTEGALLHIRTPGTCSLPSWHLQTRKNQFPSIFQPNFQHQGVSSSPS